MLQRNRNGKVLCSPRYGSFRTFGRNYLKRRYTILFYTLVFTTVAPPVTAAFGLSGVVIDSLLAVSLLAAVMPAATTEKTRSLLLAVTIALWLARPVTAWLGHTRDYPR